MSGLSLQLQFPQLRAAVKIGNTSESQSQVQLLQQTDVVRVVEVDM